MERKQEVDEGRVEIHGVGQRRGFHPRGTMGLNAMNRCVSGGSCVSAE